MNDPAIKPQLASDILKVGHHGSDTSTSEDWLDAVSPSWMVVSAGQKDVGTNKGYKHPRWSTIRELLPLAGPRAASRTIDVYDAGAKRWKKTRIWGHLYVTAKDGSVVLSTDGVQLRKE